ncbi:hypothetical protein [Nitrolancea hollandica]|uniref:Uncharacterized protein n=1 Tax=Nitrolancea hollandica Lb TaxID=1129897 RepID=I4EHS7_9BACT|nr:hypothetical protein [Nitrolancea hollandica]CCF84239.1 conserved hypothetical protein [Nitrolancea hollandica Lb]
MTHHDQPQHGQGAEEHAPWVPAENVTPEEAEFIKKHWDNLSHTTKHAKWINAVDQHEDHPGQSLATRSHAVIEHWAKERNAVPATVPGTEHEDRAGVLRFNFPGYGGRKLKEISWQEWFKTFDDRQLVFIFQEHMKNGNMSNFFQMDSPFREHE